jgi:hypothetical protein
MPGDQVLLTMSTKTDRENVADTIRAFLDLTKPDDSLLRCNAAVTMVPLDEVDARRCSALGRIHGQPALDGLRLAMALGPYQQRPL